MCVSCVYIVANINTLLWLSNARMDIEEYSWVKASEYRENLLLHIEDKPRTPKELAEMNDYYLSHVSNVLSDLDSHGLAECITPDKKKGRLWATTRKGANIVEDLKR